MRIKINQSENKMDQMTIQEKYWREAGIGIGQIMRKVMKARGNEMTRAKAEWADCNSLGKMRKFLD